MKNNRFFNQFTEHMNFNQKSINYMINQNNYQPNSTLIENQRNINLHQKIQFSFHVSLLAIITSLSKNSIDSPIIKRHYPTFKRDFKNTLPH